MMRCFDCRQTMDAHAFAPSMALKSAGSRRCRACQKQAWDRWFASLPCAASVVPAEYIPHSPTTPPYARIGLVGHIDGEWWCRVCGRAAHTESVSRRGVCVRCARGART